MTMVLLLIGGGVMVGLVAAIVVAVRFNDIVTVISGKTPGSGMTGPIIAIPAGAVQTTWADAAETSVRRGDMQVSVTRVEFGEVRAKDENNAVKVTDEKTYMQIYLTLQNKGKTPIEYQSWYGNNFGAAAASLASAGGQPYKMWKFTDVRSIRGHTPSTTIKPGEEITDVVIFSLPRGLGAGATRSYQLSLPAAAYGEEGDFRFAFPPSFVAVIPDSTDFGAPVAEDAMTEDAMPAGGAMAEDS